MSNDFELSAQQAAEDAVRLGIELADAVRQFIEQYEWAAQEGER